LASVPESASAPASPGGAPLSDVGPLSLTPVEPSSPGAELSSPDPLLDPVDEPLPESMSPNGLVPSEPLDDPELGAPPPAVTTVVYMMLASPGFDCAGGCADELPHPDVMPGAVHKSTPASKERARRPLEPRVPEVTAADITSHPPIDGPH
jgi:hypothetical protein